MLLFYLNLIETQEDKSKFEQLYIEYKRLMKYVALDILKNDSLAEDAVHDAFLRIINSLDKIEDVYCHKTKTFVVIVIKSAAIDIVRKVKRRRHMSIDDVKTPRIANSRIFEDVEAKELVSKIELLPESYRDILELKINNGLTEKEISQVLGISYSAARKRIQRAREALVALLND